MSSFVVLRKNQGGSFIGLMITALIMTFLFYVLAEKYLGASAKPKMDKETAGVVQEQKIDTSTHQSALESTKQRIKVLEQQELDRAENFFSDVQKQYP